MIKPESSITKMPTLIPKAVFGIRTDVYQNVNFFFSDKIAYLAGNYIVICSMKEKTKEKTQYFIPANPELGEITAFSVDEHKDYIWLVIAQKGTTGEKPIITLKFLNKVDYAQEDQKSKRISIEDMDHNEYFLSLGVNISKGIIVALLGPKIQAVAIFQHDKNVTKAHSVTKFSNNAIRYKMLNINYENPNFISVIGDGAYVILMLNENDKKAYPSKIETEPKNAQEFMNLVFNFVSSCWVGKTRLVCLNAACDVIIADYVNKKLEKPIMRVIKGTTIFENTSRGKAIFNRNNTLHITREDGFIVKYQDKMSDKGVQYEKVIGSMKFVGNIPKMDIHYVSLSITGNELAISTENGQLYYIDLASETALSDGNNYKPFLTLFHSEDITCLDVAKLKPLIATGSRDRYIRIWNYFNITLENSEMFDDDPTFISFHPNGLHLAVLFKEKLKLMHILEKKILPYREFNLNNPCDVFIFHLSFSRLNFQTLVIIFQF